MNILLTINDISITGGAERVCVNLANALCECGHSVEIVSFYRKNHSLPYDTQAKLNFLYDFGEDILRTKMLSNPLKRLYFKNLHKFILSLKIRRCYKNTHFIITNDWTFMPIFKRNNTRYIKIQHLRFEKYNKRNNLFDTIVILSGREMGRWQRYHSNVKVIPNFLPTIPQVSTNHSQKVVLSIGRMDNGDQKGFLRLLDIWKIVRDSNTCHTERSEVSKPSESQIDSESMTQKRMGESHRFAQSKQIKNDSKVAKMDSSLSTKAQNDNMANDLREWKLIIVGDGVLKSEIESKIRALNLGESVLLKPFTKDIEREYLSASIYAMSSHFEGFGMVLAEASSYALPCIAFDIATGPSDIIENNKSGFLVSDNDLQGYAEKIIALMNDESMRVRFGKEAKRIVSERFSKETIMNLWEKLFVDS